VSGILLALTIGFLLGILLMVLLAGGQEEEKLLERIETVESSRQASHIDGKFHAVPKEGGERAARERGQEVPAAGPLDGSEKMDA
jgi:hypothetical protein